MLDRDIATMIQNHLAAPLDTHQAVIVVHQDALVFLDGLLRQALADIHDTLVVFLFPQLAYAQADSLRAKDFQLALAAKLTFEFFHQALLTEFGDISCLGDIGDVPFAGVLIEQEILFQQIE